MPFASTFDYIPRYLASNGHTVNSDSALHRLLDRIHSGDSDAASAVYAEYVPYLKMVVRRQLSKELRGRFDSSDVVQSVWADLLVGFRKGRWSFDSPDHLRAFLVRATRNRMVDYVRRHQVSIESQQSLEESLLPSPITRPSAEARASERWEVILGKCTPQQKPIVELKRQGFTLAEIAEKTGYHPSSIRRILYALAEELEE